jgi:putative transposase
MAHKTFSYRVKSLNGLLNKQARAVSFIWNYCNDAQKHALKWGVKWPTAFDLMRQTSGTSADLGIKSTTINAVCSQYVKSRQQHKKPFLRYRGRHSLGWIPLKADGLRRSGDDFKCGGNIFRVFDPRELPGKICDGSSFSQDAKGNWFLNIVVEVADAPQRETGRSVGIDLGLKSFAALSTGETIDNPRYFRVLAEQLGKAQRARKKRQAVNIHARIANARKDFLHKLSTRIVRDFEFIAVGGVSSSKLAKTKMAKSVLDASWSSFRNMLAYKSIANGAWYQEVDERFTSQVCSSCGTLPDSRPNGIADLGVRHWICSDCGASHDRDVNSALNILVRAGHRSPVEGIAGLSSKMPAQPADALPLSGTTIGIAP